MDSDIWTTTLLARTSIAKDMVELHFFRSPNFNFLAGQFIQFIIPIDKGAKIAKRSYSLSSHPAAPDIEICVKLLPGGVASTYFEQASEATPITFTGPEGKFVCTAAESRLFFIATGSGIGPIMSIITDELKNKKNPLPLELIFGVRSQIDIFWVDRLDQLAQTFNNFTYRLTLSQPEPGWRGATGRVSQYIVRQAGTTKYFLCGSADMVKDVHEMLIARGAAANDIHFEIF